MLRRWTPALVALALAAGALAYLRWYDRPAPSATERAPDLVKLLEFDPGQVAELTVQGREYAITFRPGAGEGEWAVAAMTGGAPPGKGPDPKRMSGFLFQLSTVFAARKVVEQPEDLATWGLDRPAWVLNVKLKDGRTRTLRVGALQPVNNTYYAARDGDPAVYTINATLPASLPETAAEWLAAAP